MELKLNSCSKCGGKGRLHVDFIDTVFGCKQFLGICCSECNSKTSLYMCENKDDPEILKILTDLWNKGATSAQC